MILIAIFAPWLGTVDPTALAPAKRHARSRRRYTGSARDMLGRDVYSRVMYGARVSLIVGFSVASLASVDGHVHRPGLRLHPLAGCHRHAGDGRADVDPADPAGDRADGADPRVGAERDHRHQHRRIPPRVAAGPRRGAIAARAAVCGGGDRVRHARAGDHLEAHPAEHAGAADGATPRSSAPRR